MITNITLENFKCFRKVEINPKLVTLFIGPNGTGKSGVLQALLLLKQSRDLRANLTLSGQLVSLTPDEFMFHGSNGQSPTVAVSISGFGAEEPKETRLPAKFNIRLEYYPDGHRVSDPTGIQALLPQDERFEREESLRIRLAHLKAIEAIEFVPAARGLVRPTYRLGPHTVDQISITDLSQQENDVVTTLAYADPVVSNVSTWMKQVTGVGVKTNLVPSQSIRPVSVTPNGEVSLVAEGFGTNALVQLLLELARAEEGATILMEEPEIHLHPKAQAELTSVIVEEAKASNKQVIMTTHSEHIANRLLTLVAERQLSPDDVAIYAFEKDKDTGECSAGEIEVTDRGQVKGGLKSFFEAHMEEMRRYGDALRSQI